MCQTSRIIEIITYHHGGRGLFFIPFYDTLSNLIE